MTQPHPIRRPPSSRPFSRVHSEPLPIVSSQSHASCSPIAPPSIQRDSPPTLKKQLDHWWGVPARFYVCPQVRLADMLRIGGADRMGRMAALGEVASKSVDFAVVELMSGCVVLVELGDRSHDQAERRECDRFVSAALEYSGIPVRRFRPDTPIHIRDFFDGPRGPRRGRSDPLD
jgi:hypothetical protein